MNLRGKVQRFHFVVITNASFFEHTCIQLDCLEYVLLAKNVSRSEMLGWDSFLTIKMRVVDKK